MKKLVILSEYTYAGYCSTGGNKDWAACLAVEMDDQQTSLPTIDETTEVVYLSLHGPHGGNMIVDAPKKMVMKQARAHFTKKCHEKEGKAYAHVPFAPSLPAFGRPFGLSLITSGEEEQTGREEIPSVNALEGETVPTLPYQVAVVKMAPLAKIQQLLRTDDRYGVTEKVNGERCVLVFDGERLTAYNRRGKRMSAPPAGASHLCRLGCPFVIDGERLTGALAGTFVAFDLLEWKRESFTAFSYVVRMATLEEAMYHAGLLVTYGLTPTLAEARAKSTVNDLALLVAVSGEARAHQVIEWVQAASGEGIVVRRLESPYEEGALKWKLVTDLDAFVIAVNDGVAEGSLKCGVLRPANGAIIEVANVRSGFTDADIRVVRQMLARGERPVFTITYLPIRTVGLQLVEPRSGMALLRSDKEAVQCTTEQFELEKAAAIARAKPVSGMTLL